MTVVVNSSNLERVASIHGAVKEIGVMLRWIESGVTISKESLIDYLDNRLKILDKEK